MNSVKRYQKILINNIPKFYDRHLHKIVNFEDVRDINEVIPLFDKNNFGISIYPHPPVKVHCIPIKLIILIYSIAFSCFCISLYLAIKSCVHMYFQMIFPSILIAPIFLLISIALHESAHALVGTGLNGIVCEIGLRKYNRQFQFITVLIWRTTDSLRRALYFFAGISANMLLSFVGALVYYLYGNIVFFYIFVINVALTICNIIPIKKHNSDGYNIIMNIHSKNHCD